MRGWEICQRPPPRPAPISLKAVAALDFLLLPFLWTSHSVGNISLSSHLKRVSRTTHFYYKAEWFHALAPTFSTQTRRCTLSPLWRLRGLLLVSTLSWIPFTSPPTYLEGRYISGQLQSSTPRASAYQHLGSTHQLFASKEHSYLATHATMAPNLETFNSIASYAISFAVFMMVIWLGYKLYRRMCPPGRQEERPVDHAVELSTDTEVSTKLSCIDCSMFLRLIYLQSQIFELGTFSTSSTSPLAT
jgi:hypothetical protein